MVCEEGYAPSPAIATCTAGKFSSATCSGEQLVQPKETETEGCHPLTCEVYARVGMTTLCGGLVRNIVSCYRGRSPCAVLPERTACTAASAVVVANQRPGHVESMCLLLLQLIHAYLQKHPHSATAPSHALAPAYKVEALAQ